MTTTQPHSDPQLRHRLEQEVVQSKAYLEKQQALLVKSMLADRQYYINTLTPLKQKLPPHKGIAARLQAVGNIPGVSSVLEVAQDTEAIFAALAAKPAHRGMRTPKSFVRQMKKVREASNR